MQSDGNSSHGPLGQELIMKVFEELNLVIISALIFPSFSYNFPAINETAKAAKTRSGC